MAKVKSDKSVKEEVASSFDIKGLAGFTIFGDDETQDAMGIHEWLDTGSYALNYIAGGSIFKGIPEKRVLAVVGEEAVGKSFVLLRIVSAAQKAGWVTAYCDTENMLTKEFCASMGVDVKKLLFVQGEDVDSIEKFRRKALQLIEWKTEKFGIEKKLLIVLDTFGGLEAQKFLDDQEAGKDTVDMGIFAKIAKAMFKRIGSRMSRHNVTFIYANHVYTDSSGYVPKKEQTGGMCARFYPSNVLFMNKRIVSEGKGEDKIVSGIDVIAQMTKSRVTPPFRPITLYIDFKNGLDKTAGLFELAKKTGMVLDQGSGWYTIAGGDEKKLREKDALAILLTEESLKLLDAKLQLEGFSGSEKN